MKPAVFLDRDGVLIEDVDLLTQQRQVHILPGVPSALASLSEAGYEFIVVSNQTVVARGLARESDVKRINDFINQKLFESGGPHIPAWYFCPHHPNATIAEYKVDCDCRKPKPGLLFRAGEQLQIDLKRSFMIGDRITDILAGKAAGCRTVLVQTGKHLDPPIETSEPINPAIVPDFTCPDLSAAAAWILRQ